MVFTQYESHTPDASIVMNAVYADDGFRCIAYERTATYEGTEGELYNVNEDPMQVINLWDDPAYEDEEKLKKALDHPQVKDAAEDTLDLEETK